MQVRTIEMGAIGLPCPATTAAPGFNPWVQLPQGQAERSVSRSVDVVACPFPIGRHQVCARTRLGYAGQRAETRVNAGGDVVGGTITNEREFLVIYLEVIPDAMWDALSKCVIDRRPLVPCRQHGDQLQRAVEPMDVVR